MANHIAAGGCWRSFTRGAGARGALSHNNTCLMIGLCPIDLFAHEQHTFGGLALKMMHAVFHRWHRIQRTWSETRNACIDCACIACMRFETRSRLSLCRLRRFRAIGVSNYTEDHLEELMRVAAVKPVVNQV